MRKVLKVLPAIFFIIILTSFFTSPVLAGVGSAGITEHLGSQLPTNLKFVIKKPTVIDFVYYRCTGICTPLMIEVSDVIGKVDYEPGKDYEIISISIDPDETPKIAAEKKRQMIGLSSKRFPDSSWAFLTGDSASISKLTDAAGFGFKRTKGGFLHKGVLIIVDKTGKIVQYLNPGYVKESANFQILPAEFTMAIRKAANGELTPTIAKVLQTCFTFIPHGRTVTVLLMLFLTTMFMIFMVFIIIKKASVHKKFKST